jgi:uncharacterized membrane protein YkvA (DUF1232 family)
MSASDPGSAVPAPRTVEPEVEERLTRFYDRLRARVAVPLTDRVGEKAAATLLLAPDVFILLVRLFMDPRVPGASRSLVGGALAYFLLPADLLPEVLLGVGGYLDDVVLAAAVLTHVFSRDLRPFVERHWSGQARVQTALEDALRAGEALLPSRLYQRLHRLLARHGVDLAANRRPAAYDVDDPTTDEETYDYSRVT